MEKTTMVAKTWWECDGCEYPLSDPNEHPAIEVRIPWDGDEVTRESENVLTFHFHVSKSGTDRRDCFRYWAHGPHVMRRSLKHRGLTDDQIDEVLSVMLYREPGRIGSVGVEPPKAKQSV